MPSADHIPTLRQLRDRLSDLSLRNRALRLIRLPKKRAFDLASLDVVAPGSASDALARILSGRKTSARFLEVFAEREESIELDKSLKYLAREVLLVEQERGVYDLSLGFCFLAGCIAESRFIQAPVFLLRRRLEYVRRSPGGSHWALAPEGDPKEVEVNRTLLLALKKEGIADIDADALEEAAGEPLFAAERNDGWLGLTKTLAGLLREHGLPLPRATLEVWGKPAIGESSIPRIPEYKAAEAPQTRLRDFELRPHAALSRFPIADTSLLGDYDQLVTILETNPDQPLGFAGVLLGEPGARSMGTGKSGTEPSLWHIEPIDESQEAALARAVGGRSMAVSGPPGTGKSQFIANLVSTALALGKKVLVVSQKRPALDVVAQRLGREIEPFVALVHDPVGDRAAFCERLVKTLTAQRGKAAVAETSRRDTALAVLRQGVEWFTCVHEALTKAGPSGSACDAYASVLAAPGNPVVLQIRALPTITPEGLRAALPLVAKYVRDLRETREPGTFAETRPDYSTLGPDQLEEFVEAALPALTQALRDAIGWIGEGTCGRTLEEAARAHDAYAELAPWCGRVDPETESWSWMPALAAISVGRAVGEVREDGARLADLLSRREAAAGLELVCDPAARTVIEEALHVYEETSRGLSRLVKPAWYRGRAQLKLALRREGISEQPLEPGLQRWRTRATYAKSLETTRETLHVLHERGLVLEEFSRSELDASLRNATAAASVLDEWNALSAATREAGGPMPQSNAAVADVSQRVQHALHARAILERLGAGQSALSGWIGDASASAWISEALRQADAQLVVNRFDLAVVPRVAAFGAADRRCTEFERQNEKLVPLVRELARHRHVDAEAELSCAYSRRWMRDVEAARPVLKDLQHADVERRRESLRQASAELPTLNRSIVSSMLEDRVSHVAFAARNDIVQQAEKQRKRLPIRKMVERYWATGLSTAFPIWLCSPETVAAVFPLHRDLFDFVVFDEASQCTLPQGLTATYRGRTCIIAGDEKQLPPSNFFATTVDEDEGDELAEIVDEESLLARASSVADPMSLDWHYRSRYPELIAYSNRAFYKGRLRVAPVPVTTFSPPSLEWVPIDGRWEQTTNRAEAEAAVDILDAFLREHPERSIGVITLNRPQADLIQDLIDARLDSSVIFRERWQKAIANPDFDARPFVRNLENVQGDERDIILISIAYARGRSGKVAAYFGALSAPGGQRRLNVAVSRARLKMLVLCSFDPETQFDVSNHANEGARRLKEFLTYARNVGGPAAEAVQESSGDMDGLVADICRTLAEKGWAADARFGAKAGGVDIAVRSRSLPDRFVLGILLDGPAASWVETVVAREVGRQTYLERYHWKILHLVSRAWVLERAPALATLLSRLEDEEAQLASVDSPPSVKVRRIATAPRAASAPAIATTRDEESPGETPRRGATAPAPEPGVITVQPGCRVRYVNVTSGAEREVVLAGPGAPSGSITIQLGVPLAQGLLGAAAGESRTLDLPKGAVEVRVLSVVPAAGR